MKKHYNFNEEEIFGDNAWKFRLFMKFYLKNVMFERIDDFLDYYGEGLLAFLEQPNLNCYKEISKLANKVKYNSLKLLGYRAVRENERIVFKKTLLPLVDEEERKL